MKPLNALVAAAGVAAIALAAHAGRAQNPFPDGPPGGGRCLETCGQELGACLEAAGTALEACIAGLDRPEDIPIGVPQDVQVCLDASEIGQVGCRAAFDQCVGECRANGAGAFD